MEAICVSLKFDSCLSIDVEGRTGGLAVLWKNKIKCNVLNYSRNFVNLEIKDDVRCKWHLTCYYGFPERGRRQQAWDMLRALCDMSNETLCFINNFNDFLSQEDKRGVHPHHNNLCTGFRRAVEDCGLSDIKLEGHMFMWMRSRGTPSMVEEQPDRAMADLSWLELFLNVALLYILESHSDHNPILLQCDPVMHNEYKYMFKFEYQWLLEDDLAATVATSWNISTVADLGDKIGGCTDELHRWSQRKRARFKE